MLNVIVIRETESKTRTRYHYLLTIIAKKLKKTDNNSVVKDEEQLELSYVAGGNAKTITSFGKEFSSFLQS